MWYLLFNPIALKGLSLNQLYCSWLAILYNLLYSSGKVFLENVFKNIISLSFGNYCVAMPCKVLCGGCKLFPAIPRTLSPYQST